MVERNRGQDNHRMIFGQEMINWKLTSGLADRKMMKYCKTSLGHLATYKAGPSRPAKDHRDFPVPQYYTVILRSFYENNELQLS